MNVLLLDDHPLVRSALESVLMSLADGVKVHGAASAAQARRLLAEQPGFDLALLDLGLPDVDGMALLTQWRREHPDLRVVVISASARPEDVVRALDEGACGFIPKLTSNEVLLQALRMVLAGGIYVPPLALQGARDAAASAQGTGSGLGSVHRVHERVRELPFKREVGSSAADWMLPLQAALGRRADPAPGGAVERAAGNANSALSDPPAVMSDGAAASAVAHLRLTTRQSEVLRGLLQGQPNKLIARQLNLSVETVKDHVASVLRVLGVHSRTQAVLVVSQMLAGHPSTLGPAAAPAARGAPSQEPRIPTR